MNGETHEAELEGQIHATRQQLHQLERELIRIRREADESRHAGDQPPCEYYILPIAG